MKKFAGIRSESLLEQKLKECPEYTALYYQEGAMLELQEVVAEVLSHKVRGDNEKNWYEEASRQSGISPRSLKRFLKHGGSIKQAARILQAFGYRIATISVAEISKK